MTSLLFNKRILYSCKKNQRRTLRTRASYIDPEFLTLFAKAVCQNDVAQCMQSSVIPDAENQQNIMQAMSKIKNHVVEFHGLDLTFFRLMLANEEAKVNMLVELIYNYNILYAQIQDIVDYAYDIPFIINNNSTL